jgi:hypothetical protein
MTIKNVLNLIAVAVVTTVVSSVAHAEDFSIEFDWGDIPLCTNGNPNRVPNPRFTLKSVPVGIKFIEFKLTDEDVPSYNHGGGTIPYDGKNVIEPGAFTYKSPCPPSGSHTYRWTAFAKESDGLFSGSIAKAQAKTKYP